MDVHRSRIVVAMYRGNDREAVEWDLAHEPGAVHRLIDRIEGAGDVRCAYEAGPCGYALQRLFQARGLECIVVAPSLIPIRPGDRVKTDRRDARKLAELLRAGLLTEVRAPTEDEESIRDLCRCRDDARVDLTRARHRLTEFLLRRGLVFTRGKSGHWSQAHRWWLGQQHFERRADQVIFEDYLLSVEQREAHLSELDRQLEAVAASEPYRERVGWLRCFRGIDTITAVALLAELHDFRRFRSPSRLMAYLGLVPSEFSSANVTRRGGITRAGNRHVRRLLIEAAWHYRHKPRVGIDLRKRREGQPPHVIALGPRD
jgi:transposase